MVLLMIMAALLAILIITTTEGEGAHVLDVVCACWFCWWLFEHCMFLLKAVAVAVAYVFGCVHWLCCVRLGEYGCVWVCVAACHGRRRHRVHWFCGFVACWLFAFKFVVGQICLYYGPWGGSLVRSSLFLLRSF